MPLYFIVITQLAIITLLCINAAGAPPFCSLPGGSSCRTGSHGTFIMWRRGGLTLWRLEEFGPAHHSASETEEGGGGWREWERQKEESCLRYYRCASSAKNAVPVAQAPCQHRMTEGTVHRITV